MYDVATVKRLRDLRKCIKKEELVRCRKELQKYFLGNKRILWKKNDKQLRIESRDGTYLTEQGKVGNM